MLGDRLIVGGGFPFKHQACKRSFVTKHTPIHFLGQAWTLRFASEGCGEPPSDDPYFTCAGSTWLYQGPATIESLQITQGLIPILFPGNFTLTGSLSYTLNYTIVPSMLIGMACDP